MPTQQAIHFLSKRRLWCTGQAAQLFFCTPSPAILLLLLLLWWVTRLLAIPSILLLLLLVARIILLVLQARAGGCAACAFELGGCGRQGSRMAAGSGKHSTREAGLLRSCRAK